MPERLTEEDMDAILAEPIPRYEPGRFRRLQQALRQVREDLAHANHMRAVYDAENQESLRLLRLAEAERDAAREQVWALTEAADDYLHHRSGHGPNDVGVAAQRLDDVLSNLPAAVQRADGPPTVR